MNRGALRDSPHGSGCRGERENEECLPSDDSEQGGRYKCRNGVEHKQL